MNNELLNNIWGWLAGLFLWCFDHWSGMAAFALFVLQAIYQVYRIRQAKMECEDLEEEREGSED